MRTIFLEYFIIITVRYTMSFSFVMIYHVIKCFKNWTFVVINPSKYLHHIDLYNFKRHLTWPCLHQIQFSGHVVKNFNKQQILNYFIIIILPTSIVSFFQCALSSWQTVSTRREENTRKPEADIVASTERRLRNRHNIWKRPPKILCDSYLFFRLLLESCFHSVFTEYIISLH